MAVNVLACVDVMWFCVVEMSRMCGVVTNDFTCVWHRLAQPRARGATY